jgi:uncharacterized protein (DUF885 family)
MLKKIAKVIGVLLGVVLLAGTVFLVPTIWFKPWSIDHFYARVFLRFALRHPLILSQLRILEPMGLEFHSDDVDDLSRDFKRREARFVREELAMLRSYDRTRMKHDARVSADVLDWFLDDQQRGERFMFHDYPVNQLFGVQSLLPDFMVNTHVLKKANDAENYLRRVSKFGVAFDQIIEGVRWRAEQGIVPPRFVITKVLSETEPFANAPTRENVLYQNFAAKLPAIAGLDSARKDTLRARLAAEIDGTVKPAYRRLNACLAELLAKANDDAGVWKLPDGDAYYAHCLRSNTTTELPPDSIHALGLAEVDRLHREMAAILAAEGLPSSDPAGTLSRMGQDPRFRYPAHDSSRARILADYRTILDDAQRRSEALFHLKPKSKLAVERVPEFREQGSAGAYYDGPSFDGARPGTFYANLRDPGATVRFDMRTLAYHEGVPGHHFQVAVAMEQKGLPFFRRIIPFTSYAEGWALYAERLAYENGFESDPFDRLGALKAELFRAARLVVDTGIHRKHWTREQAIAYMMKTTGMAEAEVTTEVERYIVNPGQACAYKVGQLALLAMRDRARARLGDRFDIRDFHDIVLRNGAVPLSILDRLVDEWVEERLRQAKS